MGADVQDCRKVATLVAKKTFTNEYIAYSDLAKMIHNRKELTSFIETSNGSTHWWWNNDDIVYNNGTQNVTLLLGIISVTMVTNLLSEIKIHYKVVMQQVKD